MVKFRIFMIGVLVGSMLMTCIFKLGQIQKLNPSKPPVQHQCTPGWSYDQFGSCFKRDLEA